MRDRIRRILDENNLDPFVEAVNMIKDDEIKPETRARLVAELMKYVAPQLKSVDVDAKVAGSIRVVVDTFREIGASSAPGIENGKTIPMMVAPALDATTTPPREITVKEDTDTPEEEDEP